MTPVNPFKQALQAQRRQVGLWLSLADPYTAEICAGAGFDWLLIDAEHSPNDLRSTLAQLQAVAAYPVEPVVRPPVGDPVLIKQLLDIGARSLLIPMVESAEQAAAMVAATRYPPRGIRGVGSALARASRWSRNAEYVHHADEEICLTVQVESVQALQSLNEIAAVEGVDGVFIGPADLAASMGQLGQADHPEVRSAIEDAVARIRNAGKSAGILMSDERLARHYLEVGSNFIAVGADATLLARATTALASAFREDQEPDQNGTKGAVY